MKRRFVACLVSLSAVFLASMASIAFTRGVVDEASASVGNYKTSASTYYNGITAGSGKQLAAQLHDLITSTHQTYTTYDDNGKNKYQQNTDQYYEVNGTKATGYLYEFYSGAKWPNGWYPTAGNTSGGYNREHCWCQSLSNDLWGDTGGGADMHHLRPVEVSLNSTRGNNLYGTVSNRDSYKRYAKYGSNETYAHGGYYNGGVFEPLDSKKGDVARIILYVYLHYNSYSISSLFGSYGTTNGDGDSSYFASSLLPLTNVVKTSANTEEKAIELLLNWNTSDPVDESEQRRNEQVAKYQGNRNPFIDNSRYADLIWGNEVGITSISKTSSSLIVGKTTTISATSSNNSSINWTSSNTGVATVSSSSASSGSSITITGVAAGSATITASVTISSTTYTKTCSVSVGAAKTLSSISISDQTEAFCVNDIFAFGGTVTANYTDSTSREVTEFATFSGYNLANTGSQTVTVSYSESGSTKTKTYSIVVTTATFGEVSASNGAFSGWTSSGLGSAYKDGSAKFDSSGDNVYKLNLFSSDVAPYVTSLVVEVEGKINGTPAAANSYKVEALNSIGNPLTNDTQTGADIFTTSYNTVSFSMDSGLANCTGIKLTYVTKGGGNLGVLRISWSATFLTSIALDTSAVKKTFTVGDTFSYSGLIVTGHNNDSTTFTISSGYTVTPPSMATSGDKNVTVTYLGRTATYGITVEEGSSDPTSITATASKSFYVGDTITKSDITVKDNFENVIDDYSFSNYTFTYSDAASGGASTNKNFTITYNELSTTLTVSVSRKAYAARADTIDATLTGVSGSSYTAWSNKTGVTGSVYAGKCAASYSSVQLNSDSPNGVVCTSSTGKVRRIVISWNTNTTDGRQLDIYGKNAAYNSGADLYSNDSETKGTKLGSVKKGTSTTLDVTGSYSYVGFRSNDKAMYIDSISVEYYEIPSNLANYIMYTDTTDQCKTKFATAKGYFEGLSTSDRATFMTSDDYVISTARERLEAWARSLGKTISYSNGDYSISSAKTVNILSFNANENEMIIVIVLSLLVFSTISGYFLLRKKEDK